MVPQFAGRCKHPSQRITLLKEIGVTSKILPGTVNRGLCEVKQKYTQIHSPAQSIMYHHRFLYFQNKTEAHPHSRKRTQAAGSLNKQGLAENKSRGQDHT